ncbi:2'-5' RNA ligase family protein [Kribbella sp. CA-245084]|uniref:2'-5' RNA ligase family protein n=1 Tax=Kribbella sp. CA-245084 TaxID=3239940 RepID=UPI003D90659D
MIQDVRDHWYWRPNWRPGRSFYTWHVVFPEDSVVTEVHAAYQHLVDSLPGITPVPVRWLHLTVQGVGFTDKVPRADLDLIVEAARRRLEHFRPFEIKLGRAVVDVESLQLPVEPVDRMRRLRAQLRAAITDVWGRDSVPALPELDPHISLGYWNQVAPAEPLEKRVKALGGGIARTELTDVTLIELNRDHSQYEWTPYATVPLGIHVSRDGTGG